MSLNLQLIKIVLLFILWVGLPQKSVLAQEFHVSKLSNSPSNEVYQIFEDKKGYLWIGTNEGLYRFDGKNYTSYLNENFTNSVSGIQQDKEGRIWCNNFSGQVFYVEDNRLVLFNDYSNKYLRFPTFSVRNFPEIITVSKSKINRVVSIHFKTKKMTVLDELFVPFGFKFTDLDHLVISNDNNNLIISHYLKGNFTIHDDLKVSKLISPQNNNFRSSSAFFKNGFLIQTIVKHGLQNTYTNQVLILNQKNRSDSFLVDIKYNIYNHSYLLQDSTILWVGTDKGLILVDIKNRRVSELISLNGKQVSHIANYGKGVLLATLNHGIYEVFHKDVFRMEKDIGKLNKLMYHESSGLIGITGNGELIKVEKKGSINVVAKIPLTGKINISYDPYNNEVLCHNSFTYSVNLSNGLIKKVEGYNGVYSFKKRLMISPYHYLVASSSDLKILVDSNEMYGHEKYYDNFNLDQYNISETFSRKTGKNSFLKLYSLGKGRFFDFIFSDKSKKIYYASNKGIKYFNEGKIHEVKYNNQIILAKSITHYGEDVFCGTIHGDLLEIKESEVVQNWNQLVHHKFKQIKKLAYSGGFVFVLDNEGLYRVHVENQNLERLDLQFGVNPLSISDIELIDEMCYLAVENGLIYFNIDVDISSSGVPQIYLEDVFVNNEVIDFNQRNSFDFSQKNFKFTFRSLNKTSPKEKRYRYRLVGLSDEWVEVENTQEFAEFNNLEPGTYVFEVYAMDNSNINSLSPAKYQFEINAVLYNTWWFRALVILLLIVGISIPIYNKNKIIKKEVALNLSVQRTKKELAESQLSSLRSQMNPHFIFNALNSIQEYIVLQKQDLASTYLGKFADLMRMYLNQSQENLITLSEELKALKLYLDLEKIRFEDTLEVHFEIDDNLSLDFIQIPPILIQPYVENALKHGLLHKESNRILQVRFFKKGNYVICEIEDNGVGRKMSEKINASKPNKHKSFATSATQMRLDLLNNEKEHKIEVNIEDLYENDFAKGTLVRVQIPIL